MVASLTYRTADGARWGGGLGSDLSATQIDLNFWTLFSAVGVLEGKAIGAGIDFISQPSNGNLFYVHLTDHRVLGPFTIPTAQWSPRGVWVAATSYALYDVVSQNGSLYLITVPHTAAGTFNAAATDGLGHLLYTLILSQPSNQLPAGGAKGNKLVKASATDYDMIFKPDPLRIALFISGQPLASEMLLQYAPSDDMVLPANLVGSRFEDNVNATANAVYTFMRGGTTIGFVTFNGSSATVTFASDVTFIAGNDVLYIFGPTVPDAQQTNISMTIFAHLI